MVMQRSYYWCFNFGGYTHTMQCNVKRNVESLVPNSLLLLTRVFKVQDKSGAQAQDHILYTQKLHEDVNILSQTFHLTLRRVCIRTKVISFSPTQEKGTAKNRSQEIEGDSQGRHLTKYLFSHTWTRSKRSISLLTGLSGLGTCDPCPDS